MKRPTVYVLTQTNSRDQAEILGVFTNPDAAKRAAEEFEPKTIFNWQQSNEGFYASYDGRGHIFDYEINPFEVTE